MHDPDRAALGHAGYGRRHRGRSAGWLLLVLGLAIGLIVGAAAGVGVLLFTQSGGLPAAESTPTPTATPLPDDAWATGDGVPADVTQPGSRLVIGQEGSVVVAGAGGARALVGATPTGLVAADADQLALLRAAQPQLVGQAVTFARIDVRWISGDPLEGADLGALFGAVDASGAPTATVPIAGWDACASPAVPAGFADGAVLSLCVAAVAPEGGVAPAGVRYAPGDGPYSAVGGAPVLWLP